MNVEKLGFTFEEKMECFILFLYEHEAGVEKVFQKY